MNYSFNTTDDFDKEIKKLSKKYASLKQDFQNVLDNIETELALADDLGDGFKKIRIKIKSKGKGSSGGGRIITYETIIAIDETKVIFTSIYNKGDFDSVNINLIKKSLGLI